MRNSYETALKKHFRTAIIQYRRDKAITQEQMAQRLGMSLRCYCNLENGKSCCSAVTLMMFLQIIPDPGAFVDAMRQALEETSGVI